MAGFGFSVGDIFLASQIAARIYTTCFSSYSEAECAYNEYGRQIDLLGKNIHSLWRILSDHEDKLSDRKMSQSKVDDMDLHVIAVVVGNFLETLRKSEDLLGKYVVFTTAKRGYVTKIKWTLSGQKEAQKLTQDCAYHIAKIQFILKPLEVKLLSDIEERIHDLKTEMITRFDRVEAYILGSNNGERTQSRDLQPVNRNMCSSLPGITKDSPEFPISQKLEEQFQELFQSHPKSVNISEIPLEDWAETVMWWRDRGTRNFVRPKEMDEMPEIPPELYLNLLKAGWLIRKCQETFVYKRLEANSLWMKCICELSENIATEKESFQQRELVTPNMENLLCLPEQCFLIWPNTRESNTALTIQDEQPGEEKILSLALQTSPDHFSQNLKRELLVFRQDEGKLRLCETTETGGNGSRSSEVFTVSCANTKLFALYIAGHNPFLPSFNVLLNNGLQQKEFCFKDLNDVFSFQRAVTGSHIIFDQPGLRSILCAPRLGMIRDGVQARVQIWMDKPLSVLSEPTSPVFLSGESDLSPRPGLISYNTNSSISSTNSFFDIGENDIMEFKSPPPPRLTLFYKSRGKWRYIQVSIRDALDIHPDRCCGSHFGRIYSANSNDVCCNRTVLESSKGTIDSFLFKAEPECADKWLDVLRACPERTKKEAKKIHFRYISIDFENKEEKKKFDKGFRSAKLVHRKQIRMVEKEMRRIESEAKTHHQIRQTIVHTQCLFATDSTAISRNAMSYTPT